VTGSGPARLLVLDASGSGDSAESLVACVVQSGGQCALHAERRISGRGGAEELAPLTAALLHVAAWPATSVDLLAVVVGPGSFTGLRASLALAHGLALGTGAPVVGVTVGEALATALAAEAAERGLKRSVCAIAARRGRVFLDDNGHVTAHMIADLAPEGTPPLMGGSAAAALSAERPDLGIVLSRYGAPDAGMIAAAALRRHHGALPPRMALPLYVDPAEAKLPAGGLRPMPL